MTTLLTMKGFNKKIDYLCFTANTAGSVLRLFEQWSPTAVTLETSTDGVNWSTYTINTLITLLNVWDKVYFRNTSETDTNFSLNGNNYYRFTSWDWSSISASWDVMFLLNKNWTTTAPYSCFYKLFYSMTALTTAPKISATSMWVQCCAQMFLGCTNLTTAPSLQATTLRRYCYYQMFWNCTNLEQLPSLPAITLIEACYQLMFSNCSKIKLSTTQTWEYQTPYRIPDTWTWTLGTSALDRMFLNTWWTFTWTPTINTTYYTSNTVI